MILWWSQHPSTSVAGAESDIPLISHSYPIHVYIFGFHEYTPFMFHWHPRCQSASWEPHHSKALTRAASSIDARHGTSKASRRRPKGTRQPLALTKLSYVSYNYSMMYHDYHDLTWSHIYIYTLWIYNNEYILNIIYTILNIIYTILYILIL